jgi:hypothetical protein
MRATGANTPAAGKDAPPRGPILYFNGCRLLYGTRYKLKN